MKPQFLAIFVLVIFASLVSASLNDNILYAWTLDNNATWRVDNVSNQSMSILEGGIFRYTSGCIRENCTHFSGGGILGAESGIYDMDYYNFTFCFWFNDGGFDYSKILSFGTNDSTSYRMLMDERAGSVDWYDGAAEQLTSGASLPETNAWNQYCLLTQPNSTMIAYRNGTFYDIDTSTQLRLYDEFWLGSQYPEGLASASNYEGEIDELYIWNRSLSSVEIEELWNSGAGTFYPFAADYTPNTNHTLFNESLEAYAYAANLSEYQNFYVFANYSINGVSDTNAVCNFTIANISESVSGMAYNATSGYWENKTLFYFNYSGADMFNLSVLCNGTYDNTTYDITNVPLIINISYIDSTPFINGTVYESALATTINYSITGDIVAGIEANITYSNGTLINTTAGNFTLNNTMLNIAGAYNITISAFDNDGYEYYYAAYFIVNDTTLPVISWIAPSNDNSTTYEEGSTKQLETIFTDINLFAYRIEVYNPVGTLIKVVNETGLASSAEDVIYSILMNSTGKWTINATVDDDHTRAAIPPYEYEILDKDIIFKFPFDKYGNTTDVRVHYVSPYGLGDFSTKKETDRYTFTYNYHLLEDATKKEVTHIYRIYCEEPYIRHDGYYGHVVCWKSKQWIDFNSNDVISSKEAFCGHDCVEVQLTALPKEMLSFSSLGGLNEVSEVISFNVTEAAEGTNTSLSYFECPRTIEANMVFWALLAIAFIFIILALLIDFHVLGIFGSSMLGLLSITSFYCNALIGVIFTIITALLFLYFCVKAYDAIVQ